MDRDDRRRLRPPAWLIVVALVLVVAFCFITDIIPGVLPRNRTPVVPPTGFPVASATATSVPVEITPTSRAADCWLPPSDPTASIPFWPPGPADVGDARTLLSAENLHRYLTVMGIAAICVPPELGGLYLNVDWDEAEIGAVTGRMISLGFSELYAGSGWGRGYLVYATYDFAAGTEYDVFAGVEDYEAVRQGELPTDLLVEADNAQGFVRYHRGLCYGTCTVYRTILFPFKTHYLAIVQALGEVDGGDDWNALLVQLRAGQYPPAWDPPLPAMAALAQSLRFIEVP